MKKCLLKNGQAVIVREAAEDDSHAIEDVVNSVASEKVHVVTERSREDWDEAIRDIRSRKGLMIVAEVQRKVVGMAHLVKGKYDKNSHVGFLGMSIMKGFRSIGVGTAMMRYMIEWATQEGLEKISLTTFSTNKVAVNLYRKFGFEVEGISKKQYKLGEEYIDEVAMGKFLT